MKKSLLVLVALLTIVLIPGNVKADDKKMEYFQDCDTQKNEKAGKKVTTCEIGYDNQKSIDFKGGTTTITLKPYVESTEATFKVNTDNAKLEKQEGKKYTINIEPIKAETKAVIGTVTFTADINLSADKCAGEIEIPEPEGSDSGDVNTGEIVESGYAIPYIALAIGAVGVVTVLATSKKKTKMYKI